ncbi:MAG: SpoIIE family protein phosphatase [Planctomycetota bacterium]|jgi:sigma-B regulation protein RsbU (phosphoserine phosphatase)
MAIKTLRNKMIALIALPTLIIYVLILGAAWVYLGQQMNTQTEMEMQRLADIYAEKFNDILNKTANVADVTASLLPAIDDLEHSEEKIFQILRSNVSKDPIIYGAAMAFEPGIATDDDSLYSPYVYTTPDGLAQMDINRDVYDWYTDPNYVWFQKPKQLGRGYWTNPYFDEGAGNVLMTTYAVPFYRDGQFIGVTTVDIDLPRLKAVVNDETLTDLMFDVFTLDGEFVYSDRTELIMNETIYEIATEYNRPDLADLGDRMAAGQSGMVKIKGIETDDLYWTFYSPITAAGWTFTCRHPESVVLASLQQRRLVALLAFATALVLILACIYHVSGLITRPIVKLNKKVLDVAKGDLNVQINDIKSEDEIGTLAENFNKMTSDLRLYVDKCQTLAKLERDLQIAKQIQQRTIPDQLPVLEGFDIAAWNQPAEETGGDIYDVIGYQKTAEHEDVKTTGTADRAILMLADATGHGIGPALSVTQARAMLRMGVHISPDISVIAKHMNEQLYADLPDDKFITAWLGEVSSSTHSIRFFSAGQAPLLQYHLAGDSFDTIDADTYPFGISDTIDTGTPEPFALEKGDIFAIISDGIFEAKDSKGEQFDEQRVMSVIRENKDASAREILTALRTTVEEYTNHAPADDDRTIILIKRT